MNEMTPADRMFRKFQIQKFDPKRFIAAVNMSIGADVSRLQELRKGANEGREKRITVTHVVLKAVSDVLMDFPVLYSSFNGRKVVPNPELVLNVPVDFENHVEYIVLRRPNEMNLEELADACYEELEKIQRGEGEFRKFVAFINRVPMFIRKIAMAIPGQDIRFVRKIYGNFVVSNFGSLGVDHGVLASSRPMVGVLCMGRIKNQPVDDGSGGFVSRPILPLTITFDHRAVDGGYVGRFMVALRELLESPDELFK